MNALTPESALERAWMEADHVLLSLYSMLQPAALQDIRLNRKAYAIYLNLRDALNDRFLSAWDDLQVRGRQDDAFDRAVAVNSAKRAMEHALRASFSPPSSQPSPIGGDIEQSWAVCATEMERYVRIALTIIASK